MRKTFIMAMFSLCAFNALANELPRKIHFNENEKLKLSLSTTSYNKIFINNEKITDFYFVDGDFIVADVNDMDEFMPKDDGSIYVVPQSEKHPVIYLSTSKGHHVALEVSLNEQSGQVVSLEYGYPKALQIKPAKKVPEAQAILKDVITNKVSYLKEGFIGKQEKAGKVNGEISTRLMKLYQAGKYHARVYAVKNVSRKTVKITPQQFSEKNTKALTIEEDILKPNQTTWVYSVTGEESHA